MRKAPLALGLVVGIIGFVVSLFFWSSWGGFGSRNGGNTTVVDRDRVERV